MDPRFINTIMYLGLPKGDPSMQDIFSPVPGADIKPTLGMTTPEHANPLGACVWNLLSKKFALEQYAFLDELYQIHLGVNSGRLTADEVQGKLQRIVDTYFDPKLATYMNIPIDTITDARQRDEQGRYSIDNFGRAVQATFYIMKISQLTSPTNLAKGKADLQISYNAQQALLKARIKEHKTKNPHAHKKYQMGLAIFKKLDDAINKLEGTRWKVTKFFSNLFGKRAPLAENQNLPFLKETHHALKCLLNASIYEQSTPEQINSKLQVFMQKLQAQIAEKEKAVPQPQLNALAQSMRNVLGHPTPLTKTSADGAEPAPRNPTPHT